MKRITASLIVFVFCLLAISCSNDDDNDNGNGTLKVSGTVMSPNNGFPISRAKVKIFKGGDLISEKTTDAVGAFVIDDLPNGSMTVELSKGKFKRVIEIDLQSDYVIPMNQRTLNIFPRMAVVRGSYDEIEQVLVNVGIIDTLTLAPAFDIVSGSFSDRSASVSHGHGDAVERNVTSLPPNVSFTFNDLLHNTTLLADYDIIFLNCGAKEEFASDPIATANLKTFIENGGIVYATDWMYKYVQAMFPAPDYLNFAWPEKGGTSLTANVQVLNTDLAAWLENQGVTITPNILLQGFLGSWQMVDTFNSDNVTGWLQADNVIYGGIPHPNKELAFTFEYGDGGVFYSSFHTHGNDSAEDAIVQMMNYFIFELSSL